jgi:hypothetical protein
MALLRPSLDAAGSPGACGVVACGRGGRRCGAVGSAESGNSSPRRRKALPPSLVQDSGATIACDLLCWLRVLCLHGPHQRRAQDTRLYAIAEACDGYISIHHGARIRRLETKVCLKIGRCFRLEGENSCKASGWLPPMLGKEVIRRLLRCRSGPTLVTQGRSPIGLADEGARARPKRDAVCLRTTTVASR